MPERLFSEKESFLTKNRPECRSNAQPLPVSLTPNPITLHSGKTKVSLFYETVTLRLPAQV
jgi:hypothetical protein